MGSKIKRGGRNVDRFRKKLEKRRLERERSERRRGN